MNRHRAVAWLAAGAACLLMSLSMTAAASAATVAPTAPCASARQSDPPADGVTDEVRWRLLEAATVDVLREQLYFGDAIRARLEDKASIADAVKLAAPRIGWSDAEARAAIKRMDSKAARTSLATLVPEVDDPKVVRLVIRADLLRACAPLSSEAHMNTKARDAAVAAAIKLLRKQMPLPGDAHVWGKVDTELDRKIRSLVASRAPREQFRPWCELAAWTLLAQSLNDRALGIAQASTKWIADANQPVSADLLAVRALSLKAQKNADAKAASAELAALKGAPADLVERVGLATR